MNTVTVKGYNLKVETSGNKVTSFTIQGEDYVIVGKLATYYKKLFELLNVKKEKLIAFLTIDLTVTLENIKEGV